MSTEREQIEKQLREEYIEHAGVSLPTWLKMRLVDSRLKLAEVEREREIAEHDMWTAETWLAELPDGFISALQENSRYIQEATPDSLAKALKQNKYCVESLVKMDLAAVKTWQARAESAESRVAAADRLAQAARELMAAVENELSRGVGSKDYGYALELTIEHAAALRSALADYTKTKGE